MSTPPIKSHASRLLLIIGVAVGFFILLNVIGVIVAMAMFSSANDSAFDEFGDPAFDQPIDEAPVVDDEIDVVEPDVYEVYYLSERPRWQELVDRAFNMQLYYDELSDDPDTLFTIVPRTDAGVDYYFSFMAILNDQTAALRFKGGRTSTVAEYHDAEIEAQLAYLNEIEQKFLAGDDLGVSIRITRADGTVFESDGTMPETSIDQSIESVANFRSYVDDNNSYVAAASEMASYFGLILTWSETGEVAGCTETFDSSQATAFYCTATPSLIYINVQGPTYPDLMYRPEFIDLIKHEIAHHIFLEKCYTLAPAVAGSRWEGATSSYAAIYLGANRAELEAWGWDDLYAMSSETDDVARLVHDGRC